MPYDTLKDLAPVSMLTTTPFVLAAPPAFKANNAAEVIALFKGRGGVDPGEVTPIDGLGGGLGA